MSTVAEEETPFEGEMANVKTEEDSQEIKNSMDLDVNVEGNVGIVRGEPVAELVNSDGQIEVETPSGQELSSDDLAPEDEGSMVIVEGENLEDGANHEQTRREGTNQEAERGEESHDEGFEDITTENTDEGNPGGDAGSESTPGGEDEESEEGRFGNVDAIIVDQGADGEKSMETSMEIIEMEAKDGDPAEVISLDTLPTSDDAKVKGIQTQLLETIMLLQVINTLAIIGKYLRITTNATADDASLLISQQGALFETLKLCDSLSLMMQSFQSGANNILEKLKIAYLYLLDGFPDFAMTDIAAIAKDVDTMKTAVGKTQRKVTEMRKKVQEMKPRVKEALAKRESRLKGAEEKLAELLCGGSETDPQPKATKKGVIVRAVRIAVVCFVFIKLGITRFFHKVLRYVTSFKIVIWILDIAISVVTASPVWFYRSECRDILVWFKKGIPEEVPSNESVTHAICTFLRIESVVKEESDVTTCSSKPHPSDREDSSRLRMRQKPNSMDRTEDAEDNSSLRQHQSPETGAKMSQTTSKPPARSIEDTPEIRSLQYDIKKHKEVVHRVKLVLAIIKQTESLLDSVEGILLTSTDLVQKWYKECADIVEPSMARTVKVATRLSEEEKMKYWTSMQFQQEVVMYYCRWRALQVYSETNRSHLRKVRSEIEGYYTENLFPRDAVRFSWELASREESDPIREIYGQHQCQELRGDASCCVS